MYLREKKIIKQYDALSFYLHLPHGLAWACCCCPRYPYVSDHPRKNSVAWYGIASPIRSPSERWPRPIVGSLPRTPSWICYLPAFWRRDASSVWDSTWSAKRSRSPWHQSTILARKSAGVSGTGPQTMMVVVDLNPLSSFESPWSNSSPLRCPTRTNTSSW